MRVLAVIEKSHPTKLIEAFTALFKGMWVDAKAVHKPDVFGEVLTGVLGEEQAKAVLEKVVYRDLLC